MYQCTAAGVDGAIHIDRVFQDPLKTAFFMDSEGCFVVLSYMGIDLGIATALQHRPDERFGVALTPLVRCSFQSFQKPSIPVRLQSKGADILTVHLPDAVFRPLDGKEPLLQILVEFLLRL